MSLWTTFFILNADTQLYHAGIPGTKSITTFIDKLWKIHQIQDDELSLDQIKLITGHTKKEINELLEVEALLSQKHQHVVKYIQCYLEELEADCYELNEEIARMIGRGKYAHLNRRLEKVLQLGYQMKLFIGTIEALPQEKPAKAKKSKRPAQDTMIRIIK